MSMISVKNDQQIHEIMEKTHSVRNVVEPISSVLENQVDCSILALLCNGDGTMAPWYMDKIRGNLMGFKGVRGISMEFE